MMSTPFRVIVQYQVQCIACGAVASWEPMDVLPGDAIPIVTSLPKGWNLLNGSPYCQHHEIKVSTIPGSGLNDGVKLSRRRA